MMWDWIEKLELGAKRDDPKTWTRGKFPSDPRTGIVGAFGVGQTNFTWFLRGLYVLHFFFNFVL